MVRCAEEKSNGRISRRWTAKFNSFIMNTELREVYKEGSKFIWTNKQADPVREVLDRILVSAS